MDRLRFVPALTLMALIVGGVCILVGVALVRIAEWVWWLVT